MPDATFHGVIFPLSACLPGSRRGRDGQNGHKKNRGASHDGPLVMNIKLYIDTLSYQYKNMCSAKLRKKCTICDRLSHFFLRLSAWVCPSSWRRVLRAPKKQRSVSRRTSETMKTDMTVSHIKIIMSKNLLSLQSYNKIIPYAIIFWRNYFPSAFRC